jgi:hypothetical protein
MLRLMTFVLGFSVLAAASPGADAQTPPPSFVFVQGIVGSDIGTSYLPGLPVDVAVGSTCVRAAVSFGSGIGPFPLSVGDYTITISLANTLAPCTNSAFLTATGSVTAGQQIAVVAAESASGPEIQVYPLTPPQGGIPTGSAVLDFISAGNFPTLNLTLMNKAKGIDITIPALAPDAPPTQDRPLSQARSTSPRKIAT